jgi:hypothetical protein
MAVKVASPVWMDGSSSGSLALGTMKPLSLLPKWFDLDFYIKNVLFRKQRAKVVIVCFTVAVTLSLEEAISKLNISDSKKSAELNQLAGRVWSKSNPRHCP